MERKRKSYQKIERIFELLGICQLICLSVLFKTEMPNKTSITFMLGSTCHRLIITNLSDKRKQLQIRKVPNINEQVKVTLKNCFFYDFCLICVKQFCSTFIFDFNIFDQIIIRPKIFV